MKKKACYRAYNISLNYMDQNEEEIVHSEHGKRTIEVFVEKPI